MAWLRHFFEGGSAGLTLLPDLGPKISQDVRNECQLKFRKLQLSVSSRLAMAHEKPEEASEASLPATIGAGNLGAFA